MPLPLDSPRWHELQHAYGAAGDIPALLRHLDSLPESSGESEPWYSLWSSLAHQGDVYSASFAAVPYVILAMSRDPSAAPSAFFNFPAWVETCRLKEGVAVPEDISQDYFNALAQLPELAAQAASRAWSNEHTRCVLAAIAASKGHAGLAETVLELSPPVAERFLNDLFDRDHDVDR